MPKSRTPYEMQPDVISTETSPDQHLLIEVLNRAIRDLDDHNPEIREETVAWFSEWHNTMPDLISYKDIRDFVPLRPACLKHIQDKITCVKQGKSTAAFIPRRYVQRFS